MRVVKRGIPPALVLFFLSPLIAELLSGSAPPAEFFAPFGLLALPALYGSGAIIIRELVLRYRKGWSSLLVLGAAYGIVEEGLMVKSFFDPAWPDLGKLGVYGRWLGVNWVWCEHLIIYHAAVSIAIPILLVELMYPARRRESWVSRGMLYFFAWLLATDVVLGFVAMTKYRPPAVPYLAAVLIVLLLVRWALRMRYVPRSPTGTRVVRPFAFAVVGFASVFLLFFLMYVLPGTATPPVVTMLVAAVLVTAVVLLLRRTSGFGAAWSDVHRMALAFGALAFFVLLAPLQELDKHRTDNTHGMAVVGLAALIFLVCLTVTVVWRAICSKVLHET